MTSPNKPTAIRPRNVRSTLEIDGDQLTLIARSSGLWAVGCFMGFWLTGWTAGCVALIYKAITEPTPMIFLFGTPFWASWFAVAGFLLYTLFHRERFVFNADGLRKESLILGFGSWQQTPLYEVLAFHDRYKSDSEGSTTRWIEMQTRGRPVKLAESVAESERSWILDQLRQHLKMLHERYASSRPSWLIERDAVVDDTQKFRETSDLPTSIEPPSDCVWQRHDEFDSIQLSNRGRWSWGGVAVALFINLFWNGIVSVFLGAAFGWLPGEGDFNGMGGRIGLLLFLTPFVLIGLLMVAVLIFAVIEPLRLSRWTIERNELRFLLTWLGVGPRRNFTITPGSRLVIERLEEKSKQMLQWRGWLFSYHVRQTDLPVRYRLVIANSQAVETCSIEALSLGEAEWLASILQTERREWFQHA
jgi:hypothetical protein